jgi:hypothetical protein
MLHMGGGQRWQPCHIASTKMQARVEQLHVVQKGRQVKSKSSVKLVVSE